jgi:hypothetical protein
MASAIQWKEPTCTKFITQKKCKPQSLLAPPVGYEDNSLGINQQCGENQTLSYSATARIRKNTCYCYLNSNTDVYAWAHL